MATGVDLEQLMTCQTQGLITLQSDPDCAQDVRILHVLSQQTKQSLLCSSNGCGILGAAKPRQQP